MNTPTSKIIHTLGYLVLGALGWLSPALSAEPLARRDSLSGSKEHSAWRFTPHLSLQYDGHYSTLGEGNGRGLSNTYIDLGLTSKYLDLGGRYEGLSKPMPGYEHAQGKGISNLYLRLRYRGQELHIGDIYEQFGSGLLLRLYEDRTLGIDNSLRGAKLRLSPHKSITLKLLGGQQRNNFDRPEFGLNAERGFVYGADAEVSLLKLFPSLADGEAELTFGSSYVLRSAESQQTILRLDDPSQQLRFPRNVGAWGSRLEFRRGPWELFAEYAMKGEDPNVTNGYTFGIGQALMLTASYSGSNWTAFAGARRSEGFDFRSTQHSSGLSMRLNHLLPFTQVQSYAMAGINPYNTQASGEWAWQGELNYRLARGSKLGGRYGTHLRLSASYIYALRSLGDEVTSLNLVGADSRKTSFWGMGAKYFHDISLEISRKFSRAYSLNLLYTHQYYNRGLLEGYGGQIYSHTLVYDAKHQLSRKLSLRTELQGRRRVGMDTWLYASAELGLAPGFAFSLSYEWCPELRLNYPYASVSTTWGTHRILLGVGKTSSGMSCSGGVCRYMPEMQGFFLSYSYSL
ncbi:MAG: DUF6029 family protein [Porphyromonas sp.]|nr:DUF6029 family protein [Porphyromonas sp.]